MVFFLFLHKNVYVVSTHYKPLAKVLVMSIQNICFHGETKIFYWTAHLELRTSQVHHFSLKMLNKIVADRIQNFIIIIIQRK